MFTVGIFSTHLPYLAFVFFYAWFMLFGVQKASNGEPTTVEKSCFTEIHSLHQTNTNLTHQNFHYTDFYSAHIRKSKRKIQLKQKIKYGCSLLTRFKPGCCSISLFNRPPPAQ